MPKTRVQGFTIIELLVVVSIIALLIAILLPSLATARDRARYIKWAAYSHGLRTEPEMVAYYNFEQQDGSEAWDNGFGRLRNRAAGIAESYRRDVAEPEDYDGQLGDDSYTAARIPFPESAPKWNFTDMRWKGKGGMNFEGSVEPDRIYLGKSYQRGQIPRMTVFSWVLSNNSTDPQVIAAWDRSTNFRFSLKNNTGSTSNVGFHTASRPGGGGDIHDMTTSQDYTDGTWHLIAATYNKDGVIPRKRIVVDGEIVQSADDPHNGEPLGQLPGDDSEGHAEDAGRRKTYGLIGVGSECGQFAGGPTGEGTGPTLFLDALLDEVGLLEREFSTEELVTMFRVGKPREKR